MDGGAGRKALIRPCRILETVLVYLSIIPKATEEQLQSLNKYRSYLITFNFRKSIWAII